MTSSHMDNVHVIVQHRQTDFTRKQCLTNWDEWLYPELVRGWNIKYGNEVPYQEEKDALEDHEQSQTIDD